MRVLFGWLAFLILLAVVAVGVIQGMQLNLLQTLLVVAALLFLVAGIAKRRSAPF